MDSPPLFFSPFPPLFFPRIRWSHTPDPERVLPLFFFEAGNQFQILPSPSPPFLFSPPPPSGNRLLFITKFNFLSLSPLAKPSQCAFLFFLPKVRTRLGENAPSRTRVSESPSFFPLSFFYCFEYERTQ